MAYQWKNKVTLRHIDNWRRGQPCTMRLSPQGTGVRVVSAILFHDSPMPLLLLFLSPQRRALMPLVPLVLLLRPEL